MTVFRAKYSHFLKLLLPLVLLVLAPACEFGFDDVLVEATATQPSEGSSSSKIPQSSLDNSSGSVTGSSGTSSSGSSTGDGLPVDPGDKPLTDWGSVLFGDNLDWNSASQAFKDRANASFNQYADPTQLPGGVSLSILGADTPVPASSSSVENPEQCDAVFCLIKPQAIPGVGAMTSADGSLPFLAVIRLDKIAPPLSDQDPIMALNVYSDLHQSSDWPRAIKPHELKTSLKDPEEGIGGMVDLGTHQETYGKYAYVKDSIPLGQSGKHTVVISMYKKTEAGFELVSQSFDAYRAEQPEIEIEDAFALGGSCDSPTFKNSINNNDKVSAACLQLNVRLKSDYSPGLRLVLENYDKDGKLINSKTWGHVSSNGLAGADEDGVYKAKIELARGTNRIRVLSLVPEDEDGFARAEKGFQVFNYLGAPKLKMVYPDPEKGQSIVSAIAGLQNTNISLQYCLTQPDNANQCMSDTNYVSNLRKIKVFFDGELVSLVRFGATGTDTLVANGSNNNIDIQGPTHCTPASATCSTMVWPKFGGNTYRIESYALDGSKAVTSGSFLYGLPLWLVKNNQPYNDNFVENGIEVKIDASFFYEELKPVLEAYLTKPSTAQMIFDSFHKDDTGDGYYCAEADVVSLGNKSVTFFSEDKKYGIEAAQPPSIENITLDRFQLTDAGTLEIIVTVHNFFGDAARYDAGLGMEEAVTEGNFTALRFTAIKLPLALAIKFEEMNDVDLDGDGEIEDGENRLTLNITKIPGIPVVDEHEALGLNLHDQVTSVAQGGRLVRINTEVNPANAGMGALDEEDATLLKDKIVGTITGTALCGIENKVNNRNDGILGDVDSFGLLRDITNTDSNAFRFDLEMELLNKALGFSVAAFVPGAKLILNSEGLKLKVAARAHPIARQLIDIAENLAKDYGGNLGTVEPAITPPSAKNLTSPDHNLGIALNQALVNQLLLSANLMGLFDFDGDNLLDANWYRKQSSVPSSVLLPIVGNVGDGLKVGNVFAYGIDVNRDGNFENDYDTRIGIGFKTYKDTSPTLTFLKHAEVEELARLEEEAIQEEWDAENAGVSQGWFASNDGPGQNHPGITQAPKPFFDTSKHYFKFTISGVLSVYEQEVRSDMGAYDLCEVNENKILGLKGKPGDRLPQEINSDFCPLGVEPDGSDATTLMRLEDVPAGYECLTLEEKEARIAALKEQDPEADTSAIDRLGTLFRVPRANGPVISRPRLIQGDNGLWDEDPEAQEPIYSIRIDAKLIGRLLPVSKERSVKDYLGPDTELEEKDILRIQLAPGIKGIEGRVQEINVKVLSNTSGKDDAYIRDNIFRDFVIKEGFAPRCGSFSEFRVPVSGSSNIQLLKTVFSLFGETPQIKIDENKSSIDINLDMRHVRREAP